MYKESFNGNDGTTSRNGGDALGNSFSSTLYTSEDFGLKINEGSLSEPSFFSPDTKPHIDIYHSNRRLDLYLFHLSSRL